jgi:hypothetical protein
MRHSTPHTIPALILVAVLGFAISATAQTTIFGSDNDGLGGFTHTAIDNTNTFLTTGTNSVTYRNQSTGTVDAGFIKQLDGTVIDRTPDTGIIYTISGTVTINDGYADDNNRLGMILFTDPTTVLSRTNTGHIGIVWNTDDSSTGGSPGSNADDNLSIADKYETPATADATVPAVGRNQATPFAQDILQGTEVTWSTTFSFTGANINIDATMTDNGGVTSIGTAVVAAADYTGDYFGFVSAFRSRNYDGTPDPTGAARDNPLVLDYESFSVTSIPEPSSIALFLVAIGAGIFGLKRRRS